MNYVLETKHDILEAYPPLEDLEISSDLNNFI